MNDENSGVCYSVKRVTNEPAHAVRCFKADGQHSVWLIHPPREKQRILKRWPLNAWTLVKVAIGISQPQRQMRGIRRLRRLGIHAPQCYHSWRIRLHSRQPWIELMLEYAPGKSAWELVCTPEFERSDDPRLRASARNIGDIVARMIKGGIFHRDLKLSNIVVDLDQPHPRVYLIDTVGVRLMRRKSVEAARMLERLAVQPMALPVTSARRLRIAALLAAMRPLVPADRREILRQLRMYTGRGSRSARSESPKAFGAVS